MAKKNQTLDKKSAAELADEAGKLKKELFDLRFKNSTKSLSDTMALRRTRRQIARVLTVAKQKSTTP
ncbi:MAG: 50S ribosomal protein L29 [Deltaproteobacteria bacterium RBG_16_71_12]|nr:MAG: 50S ribosomal protein L29 [Deltaproteobacteria bacterium RBG_16_71_12]